MSLENQNDNTHKRQISIHKLQLEHIFNEKINTTKLINHALGTFFFNFNDNRNDPCIPSYNFGDNVFLNQPPSIKRMSKIKKNHNLNLNFDKLPNNNFDKLINNNFEDKIFNKKSNENNLFENNLFENNQIKNDFLNEYNSLNEKNILNDENLNKNNILNESYNLNGINLSDGDLNASEIFKKKNNLNEHYINENILTDNYKLKGLNLNENKILNQNNITSKNNSLNEECNFNDEILDENDIANENYDSDNVDLNDITDKNNSLYEEYDLNDQDLNNSSYEEYDLNDQDLNNSSYEEYDLNDQDLNNSSYEEYDLNDQDLNNSSYEEYDLNDQDLNNSSYKKYDLNNQDLNKNDISSEDYNSNNDSLNEYDTVSQYDSLTENENSNEDDNLTYANLNDNENLDYDLDDDLLFNKFENIAVNKTLDCGSANKYSDYDTHIENSEDLLNKTIDDLINETIGSDVEFENDTVVNHSPDTSLNNTPDTEDFHILINNFSENRQREEIEKISESRKRKNREETTDTNDGNNPFVKRSFTSNISDQTSTENQTGNVTKKNFSHEMNMKLISRINKINATLNDTKNNKKKQTQFFERNYNKSSNLSQDLIPNRMQQLVQKKTITYNDTKFIVSCDGNVLNITDRLMAGMIARKTEINGLLFYRTSSGNLWHEQYYLQSLCVFNEPCISFTKTGRCNSLDCRFKHDRERLAICQLFLNDNCNNPNNCFLSHNITQYNTPLCIHGTEKNCNNSDCKYSHETKSPQAKICRAFAYEGYCELGRICPLKHIYKCPEFVEYGMCSVDICTLPHSVYEYEGWPHLKQFQNTTEDHMSFIKDKKNIHFLNSEDSNSNEPYEYMTTVNEEDIDILSEFSSNASEDYEETKKVGFFFDTVGSNKVDTYREVFDL